MLYICFVFSTHATHSLDNFETMEQAVTEVCYQFVELLSIYRFRLPVSTLLRLNISTAEEFSSLGTLIESLTLACMIMNGSGFFFSKTVPTKI